MTKLTLNSLFARFSQIEATPQTESSSQPSSLKVNAWHSDYLHTSGLGFEHLPSTHEKYII